MIWGRVDPALSKQLSLWRYIGALIVALLLVPAFFALLSSLLDIFADLSLPYAKNLSNFAFLGVLSGFVAWAYLLATLPLFLLARAKGYIGLLPTVLSAIIIGLLLPTYELSMHEPPYDAMTKLAFAAILFYAPIYSVVVWLACLKLHPGLFSQTPPQAPTAGHKPGS